MRAPRGPRPTEPIKRTKPVRLHPGPKGSPPAQYILAHTRKWCEGEVGCPLHSPTDHAMRTFRQVWDNGRKVMHRQCPHNYLHPDPDDLTVRLTRAGRWHTCCRYNCCGLSPQERGLGVAA